MSGSGVNPIQPQGFRPLAPRGIERGEALPIIVEKVPNLAPREPMLLEEATLAVRQAVDERIQQKNRYYGAVINTYETLVDHRQVNRRLDVLREEYETEDQELFIQQKEALAQFVKSYNFSPDPALLAEIQQLVVEQDVGNSSRVIIEGRLQMLQAVYERKFALTARLGELNRQIATKWWNLKARYQRWKVEKTLATSGNASEDESQAARERLHRPNAQVASRDRERNAAIDERNAFEEKLGAAPTPGYLSAIGAQIARDLEEPSRMVSIEEAKQLHALYDKQLAWGKPYLKYSLASPSNWTSIRRFALKTHHTGRLYCSITELEPASNPIPSTLRKKRPEQATNLWKETHYILGREWRTTSVKFRHGQFPTPEAARQALKATGAKQVHINSLLTPTRLRSDYSLLATHKASIEQALENMGGEAPKVILSNFGVNEGAVGTMEILGFGLRLGWQTSTEHYNNDAVDKLTHFLEERLAQLNKKLESHKALEPEDEAIVRNLDGIVAIARRMNRIWAKNRYAYAGEDQFEMTALWSALDALLGITTMTNCMSGKDRTGEVSSDTYSILDEVHMDLIVRDTQVAEEDVIFHEKGLTKAEIVGQRILAGRTVDLPLHEARDLLLATKLSQAASALTGESPFMARKTFLPGAYLMPGVSGISQEKLLRMPRNSFYKPDKAINRQRDAENRRQNALGSGMLRINQKNTGRAGTKLRATDSKITLHCGFDIPYVLANLPQWKHLVRLHELGSAYQSAMEERWHHEDKRALLKEIARDKTQIFRPIGKVQA